MLNLAHYTCPNCSSEHALFGKPEAFRATARRLGLGILGELGLISAVGAGSDAGVPFMLSGQNVKDLAARKWLETMAGVAERVSRVLR